MKILKYSVLVQKMEIKQKGIYLLLSLANAETNDIHLANISFRKKQDFGWVIDMNEKRRIIFAEGVNEGDEFTLNSLIITKLNKSEKDTWILKSYKHNLTKRM